MNDDPKPLTSKDYLTIRRQLLKIRKKLFAEMQRIDDWEISEYRDRYEQAFYTADVAQQNNLYPPDRIADLKQEARFQGELLQKNMVETGCEDLMIICHDLKSVIEFLAGLAQKLKDEEEE